jgi:hypothetical protein
MMQNKQQVYNFRFSRGACSRCPVHPNCTKAAQIPRALTIRPQPVYEALRAARQRQQEFPTQYAKRAGVEGLISQGVAIADLRRARYIGLLKTRHNTFLLHLG